MSDTKSSRPKLVGSLIKETRESLGISQKSLGQKFSPPVTIQFISNLERGKTPLPLHHVPSIAKSLGLSESTIKGLLEQEYALKISGKIPEQNEPGKIKISVLGEDADFFLRVYEAYRAADAKTRQEFTHLCRSALKLR